MLFKKKDKKKPELSFQEASANALFVALEDALIIYDKSFKVIQLNKAAESILKVKATDVVGKIFSLDKAKGFKSKIMAQAMFPSLAPTFLRQSKPGQYPQILDISLDEPRQSLRIITNQILDISGRPIGFIKLIKDKTRERDLAKAKSDFVTIAAHQLRTPTTGINWALKNLISSKKISGEEKETLTAAHKATKGLLNTINDLISLSQLEEGKFAYKFKSINLVNLLGKILAQADLVAKEGGVKLYFQPPASKAVTVKADAEKLSAALSNLIDNGIKYNVENGEVIVSVRQRKGWTDIHVKDTGVGMSKEDLDKLFTKFTRGASAKKVGISGSGLGLYLVKRIIEAHEGKVGVKSVPDRGTTFTISLPHA